jgi:hypothetical protein
VHVSSEKPHAILGTDFRKLYRASYICNKKKPALHNQIAAKSQQVRTLNI